MQANNVAPRKAGKPASRRARRRRRFPLPVWFIAVAIVWLALAYMLQAHWFPDGITLNDRTAAAPIVSEIEPVSGIAISEVMSANRTAWAGDGGEYADWVELINRGDKPVDITGWTLTDKATRRVQFQFPAQTLNPGELVLVYLTGQLRAETGAAYQAPFKLSSTGDALLLYDAGGAIMESLNLPALPGNHVYAREQSIGAWSVSDAYTPGLTNTAENHRLLTEDAGLSDSPIALNELMAENRNTLKDMDGEYSDWIELWNAGSDPVDLGGYSLSDDPQNPQRWRVPAITLSPGEYLVVFASGKDKVSGRELHTNFKLNGEGETVILTDPNGRRVASIKYELLKAGQVAFRQADGSYAAGSNPTPGRANS